MNNAAVEKLELDVLASGLPGITPSLGGVMGECCALCLESQKHSSGVNLEVEGQFQNKFSVCWSFPVNDQLRRAHADTEVATEYGAYAVAFLIVTKLTELTVIERAVKGGGFDFWLGKSQGALFQDKTRLEVSGIRQGNQAEISARLRQKEKQVIPSDRVSAAYIVVVEFSQPYTKVLMKCKK